MEKGKGVMGAGRRWAVDFTDNSTTHSSRGIPDPPGFSRASQDQVSISLPFFLPFSFPQLFYQLINLFNCSFKVLIFVGFGDYCKILG